MNDRAPLLSREVSSSSSVATGRGQRVLSIVPVAFFVFVGVSGGPYATEGSLQAAGAAPVLLGYLLLPFLWSFPVALIVAELSSAFPQDSSSTAWMTVALGNTVAFAISIGTLIGNVCDAALYPSVLVKYLELAFSLGLSPLQRWFAQAGVILVFTALNMCGLRVVGSTAVIGSILLLIPFALITVLALPDIDPANWTKTSSEFDPIIYLNVMLWSLNGFEVVTSIAGNIDKPGHTFPISLGAAGLLVVLCNLVPLLAMTGVDSNFGAYTRGHFLDIATSLGGDALRVTFVLGAVVYGATMFCVRLAAACYTLEGIADQGYLPRILARRSQQDIWCYVTSIDSHAQSDSASEDTREVDGESLEPQGAVGAPLMALSVTALLALAISMLSFDNVLKIDNVLYCIALIAEIASFLILRFNFASLPRPFKIPVGHTGAIALCVFPGILALSLVFITGFGPSILALAILLGAGLVYQVTAFLSGPHQVVEHGV